MGEKRHLSQQKEYEYIKQNRAHWRELTGPERHDQDDIDRIYNAQRGRCLYCGALLDDKYVVDHFVPRSRKGGDGPDNLAICCASCNNRKRNRLPWLWDGWNGQLPVEWDLEYFAPSPRM